MDLKQAIADHFGINEIEVIHDDDMYPDEFMVKDGMLEVVTPGVAISNEMDFGNKLEVRKIEIGMYTWLNNGEYLFRWL